MRWALAWLLFWATLCLYLGGCSHDPTCYRRCDEMCTQRSTADRSDYKRQLNCVRCLEACAR